MRAAVTFLNVPNIPFMRFIIPLCSLRSVSVCSALKAKNGMPAGTRTKRHVHQFRPVLRQACSRPDFV